MSWTEVGSRPRSRLCRTRPPGAMTWSWSPSEPTSWSPYAPGSPGWSARRAFCSSATTPVAGPRYRPLVPGEVRLVLPRRGRRHSRRDRGLRPHQAATDSIAGRERSPPSRNRRECSASAGSASSAVTDIDGWLAYHAAFVACVCAALYRCGTDAARLAADRPTLNLMCAAVTEAFTALRKSGATGLPRNLAVLHSTALRPVAVRYWAIDHALRRPGSCASPPTPGTHKLRCGASATT